MKLVKNMEEQDNYVYPQYFDIVGAMRLDGVPNFSINGREKYMRILINPIIKGEERTHEIIDEDTNTVYVVPEWMIPTIVERIEYERMIKDWKKTNKFDYNQNENLGILELMLYKSGEDDYANLIKNQRLEDKQPEVYDYDTLFNEGLKLVKAEAFYSEKRRLTPIYRLRNESLPTIFNMMMYETEDNNDNSISKNGQPILFV